MDNHSAHRRSISPFPGCGEWVNKGRRALRTEERMHGGTDESRAALPEALLCLRSRLVRLKTGRPPAPAGLRLLINARDAQP